MRASQDVCFFPQYEKVCLLNGIGVLHLRPSKKINTGKYKEETLFYFI